MVEFVFWREEFESSEFEAFYDFALEGLGCALEERGEFLVNGGEELVADFILDARLELSIELDLLENMQALIPILLPEGRYLIPIFDAEILNFVVCGQA